MSTSPPKPGQGASAGALHPPPGRGPQRVLACVNCAQRKIKCSRRFPCASCVKHGIRCVPATPTPQRKRRFPERELLDRLRSHEELLRRHNIEFEPLHRESALGERLRQEDGSGAGDETPNAGGDASSASASVKSENTYETRSLWQAMAQETPDDEEESPLSHALETTVSKTWAQACGDDNILFGFQGHAVNLAAFHPEPVNIFRLWQIYLDNVNPLLKVTHTPSLQVRIIEAAGNMTNIGPALEALMFSIYCVSIISIDEEECRAMFGVPRDDLLAKYRFGCQQALANAEFLRSADRDCLTALHLYLLSLHSSSDPRSLCSMSGMVIRIAQCMGIHRESSLARCTPFEAEMRRRLWWSLVLYDARRGEMADYKDSSLAPTWDCRVPLNVNDSDLRPEMKELPTNKTQPTDSFFAVLRSKLADFVRHTPAHLEFTNPALKPVAREVPEGGAVAALERRIESEDLAGCDEENPVHFMAMWHARWYLARCHLLEHYASASGRSGQPTDAQLDKMLSLAMRMVLCDTKMMTAPHARGYRWFLRSHFPFPAFIHIVHDLRRRPRSGLAGRAWEVMSDNYDVRFPFTGSHLTPIFKLFSRLVLSAWEAYEAVVEPGEEVVTPRIVQRVRERTAEVLGEEGVAGEKGGGAGKAEVNASAGAAPVGFGEDSFMYGLGPQDEHAGANAMGYTNVPGPDPFQFMSNQFNWPPMDWGPG